MHIKDNQIILEKNEYSNMFSDLDGEFEYPQYIQKIVLELFHEYSKSLYNCKKKSIYDMLDNIDEQIITRIIEQINVELYVDQKKTDYSDKHLAYLLYYLPCNTHKIQKVLCDLLMRNKLKSKLSVLDIGTGPGSIPIGIIDFFCRIAKVLENDEFSISFTIVDAEKSFIEMASELIEKAKKFLPENLNVELKTMTQKVGNNTNIKKQYDLITMSNFLNVFELNEDFDRMQFINKIRNAMYEDSSLIIIEPGDEDNCKDFKEFRNQIVNNGDLFLFSPCNPLWGEKDEYNCSCFSTARVLWEKPSIIKFLNDNGLGKRRQNVPYNYAIFRKESGSKYKQLSKKDKDKFLRLDTIEEYFGERVSVVGFVRCLKEMLGKLYISICDGTFEATDKKSIWIYFELGNKTVNDRFGEVLRTMNVGQKIEINNGLCEKGRKYPKSTYILLDKETDVTCYY